MPRRLPESKVTVDLDLQEEARVLTEPYDASMEPAIKMALKVGLLVEVRKPDGEAIPINPRKGPERG